MASPIRIAITNGNNQSSNNQSLPTQNVNVGQNNASSNVLRSVGANQLVNFAVNSAKTIITNELSMHGDYTGNLIEQANIDRSLSFLSESMSVGGAVVSGALVGGIPGAIISGGVAIGSNILNNVQTVRKYNLNVTRTNQNAAFSSALIGDILTGGNR